MDFLNPALDELRDLVVSVWPQLVKNDDTLRYWRGEHVAVCPLETLIREHGLPHAVCVANSAPAGIDAEDSYETVTCEVYLVAENAGPSANLLTRGQELRDALWPADPLVLAQVATKPAVSTGLTNRGNATLRQKKEGLLSVAVTFSLLTGEPVEV